MIVKNNFAPYVPPKYEKKHVASWQAITQGKATEHQQKLFAEYLVYILCGTYDMSYRPGGEEAKRDTDFAEGRRFVGNQLVKFSNLSLANFNDDGIVNQAVKRATRKRTTHDQ